MSVGRSVWARLRGRPALVVPFTLLGCLAAVVDALRLADPVATVPKTAAQLGWVNVDLGLFPAAVSAVDTRLGAVLGLRLRWLLQVGVLEGLVLLATPAALLAVTRVLDGTVRTPVRSYLRLLAYELAVLVGTATVSAEVSGLLGIAVFVLAVYVVARLFPVPGMLARGEGFRDAVLGGHERARWSTGTRIVVLAAVALAAHLLVSVPVLTGLPLPVGTVLATAVAGTGYALATLAAAPLPGPTPA